MYNFRLCFYCFFIVLLLLFFAFGCSFCMTIYCFFCFVIVSGESYFPRMGGSTQNMESGTGKLWGRIATRATGEGTNSSGWCRIQWSGLAQTEFLLGAVYAYDILLLRMQVLFSYVLGKRPNSNATMPPFAHPSGSAITPRLRRRAADLRHVTFTSL